MSEKLLKQFVTRIRALDQRVNEFSSMHVKNRIYADLLRRARPDPTNSRQDIVSPPPIHADIAYRAARSLMRQGPGFANNFARSRIFSSRATISRRVLTRPRRGAFVLTNVPKLVDKIQDSFDANRATEAVATRLNFVICRLSEQIFRVDKWSACQG